MLIIQFYLLSGKVFHWVIESDLEMLDRSFFIETVPEGSTEKHSSERKSRQVSPISAKTYSR